MRSLQAPNSRHLFLKIEFAVADDDKLRALPDGSFCGAGLITLCLPPDFHLLGPRACENCKRLIEVNLMSIGTTSQYWRKQHLWLRIGLCLS